MKSTLLVLMLMPLSLLAQDFSVKIPGSIKVGTQFSVKCTIKDAPGIYDKHYKVYIDCVQCPGYFGTCDINIPQKETYGYCTVILNAPLIPQSIKVGGLAKGDDEYDGCWFVPCATTSNTGTVINFKQQEIPVVWGNGQ